MKKDLFCFDVPHCINRFDMTDILCNLEALAMCAFYIAGDDQMGLKNMVENGLESSIDEFDPESVYAENYNELMDIVEGYNFSISKNKSSTHLIQLVVDDEKTSMLREGSKYKINKIIQCDGLID